jgi:PKD repeat protein
VKLLIQPTWSILIGLILLLAPAAQALPGDPCHPDCGGGDLNTRPGVTLGVDDASKARGQGFVFTASTEDADGGDLTYSWDIDNDGQFDDGSGTVAAGENVTKSVFFSTLGTKTVGVKVDDGSLADTDTITVQVINRAPTGVGFSKNPASPVSGEVINFTAFASDPDGDAISYSWDFNNDGFFGDATGSAVSRSFSTPGTYTVRVRAMDSLGDVTLGAPTSVVIGNRGPTASFTTFPGSPLTGEVVSFDSTASSDPDGSVASRAWDLDDDGQFDDGASVTASRNYLFPGTYTVALRVTDNLGSTATREESFTVTQAPTNDPGTGTGTGTGTETGTGTGGTAGSGNTGGGSQADVAGPTWSFAASAQRPLKSKRIVFSVKPNEPCVLVAVLKLGKKKLATLRKQLAAGQTGSQRVKLGRKALGLLRSALARKRTAKLSITLTCVDAAGNAGSGKKSLTVRR